ncbi:hypothetical protein WJX73_008790 [Symbiochloris irregularis]|uniref:Uncharacterized protein n=1 Tax=Symbiochloris irregularis TaxID=706552 RepID=A0AAW1Q248_9CHLO
MVQKFKDPETGKSGPAGVAEEGKQRYQEYNKDKADGKVNWGQEGKDAFSGIKAGETGGSAPAGGAPK